MREIFSLHHYSTNSTTCLDSNVLYTEEILVLWCYDDERMLSFHQTQAQAFYYFCFISLYFAFFIFFENKTLFCWYRLLVCSFFALLYCVVFSSSYITHYTLTLLRLTPTNDISFYIVGKLLTILHVDKLLYLSLSI